MASTTDPRAAGFDSATFRDAIRFAWLAGIMEGEGSFGAIWRGPNEYAPRVALGMTDEDVVREAMCVAGCGRFYGPYDVEESNVGPGPFKERYQWIAQGVEAIEFMEKILPFMYSRRADVITQILLTQKKIDYERSFEYKFWSRVTQSTKGCLLWEGNFKDGIPNFWHKKSLNPRVILLDLMGMDRPFKKISVNCGESSCINPYHIEGANREIN